MGGLGWTLLIVLAIAGAVVGYLASRMNGNRKQGLSIAVGAIAAIAAPFILAAIGLGTLVAGGIIITMVAAMFFAVVVLAIVRAVVR